MRRPVEVKAAAGIAAVILATKFAEAWRHRVMKALIGGAENPAGDAATALRSRLDTIAVTESARSYNETRRDIAESFSVPSNKFMVKRWDAQLDACPYCWQENGTVVPINESFPGGTPGAVHPRCQCVEHYEVVSAFEFYAMRA